MRKDEGKTKEQLLNELEEMRQRIKELEASETDHKRVQEALVQSEEQFRQFFENEPEFCYMISPEGIILHANRAALEALGYKKEQLVGKPLQTIYAPESVPKMKRLFAKWKETGALKNEEIVILTKEGNRLVVLLSASTVRDMNGKLLHSVSVQKDITERKRLEHDLVERVKELECLYSIATIAERPHIALDSLYQEIANLLPDAWQYPEIACARVIMNDKRHETENWRETQWKQSSDVKVHGVKAGAVEVCYLEERPPISEGPFLIEERHLIDAVAERLGRITEHRWAEEAREKSEEKYRELANSITDVFFGFDTGLRYNYWNRASEELTGIAAKDALGKHLYDIFPKDEQTTRAEEAYLKVLRTKQPQHFVNEYQLGGKDFVFEISAYPSEAGLSVFVKDITERKRLEEALRESEENLRSLLNSMEDLVFVIAMDGTFKNYYQPWGREDLYVPPSEFVGKNFKDVLPLDVAESLQSAMRGVETSGETQQFDYVLETKGKKLWYDARVSPVKDQSGAVKEVIAVVRNITEHKQLEEARMEQAAALARAEEVQRSRQRITVMQESLRKDIAQQIHSTVQNRLIIIMHRLADLERSSLSEQMAAELADLRQKLEEVLQGYIRPISHRLFPSILRRGLVPTLQSLVDQLEKTQSIDMELSEELKRQERINPRFITEQVRLAAYRIAEEAVTNATKHAKASRVTVKLELSSEAWLHLTVRDNGRGFEVESASAGSGNTNDAGLCSSGGW